MAQTFSHAAEHAEEHLREAEKLARAANDSASQATVLNNLGILLAGQGKLDEARKAYQGAASLASQTRDGRLLISVRGNLADVSLRSADFAGATAENAQAESASVKLSGSHAKAFALAHCGRVWESLFAEGPAHEQQLRVRALDDYRNSAKVAEAIGDSRALAYALGYTGHLYEQEKKYAEAEPLTRRASFLAQQAHAPESLYLWEWQTARMPPGPGLQQLYGARPRGRHRTPERSRRRGC